MLLIRGHVTWPQLSKTIEKQNTYQPLADLEKNIRVVESSAMILPCELDVCAWFGILPWNVIVLPVICHWSDWRGEWMNERILTILPHLIHYLTW